MFWVRGEWNRRRHFCKCERPAEISSARSYALRQFWKLNTGLFKTASYLAGRISRSPIAEVEALCGVGGQMPSFSQGESFFGDTLAVISESLQPTAPESIGLDYTKPKVSKIQQGTDMRIISSDLKFLFFTFCLIYSLYQLHCLNCKWKK